MGKNHKKNGGKPPQNKNYRFELEENAQEIFLEHLENCDNEELLAKEPHPPTARSRKEPCKLEELDLHGLTLTEALNFLERRIKQHLLRNGVHRMRIITGRGLHSGKKSVLPKEVHRYIAANFAKHIVYLQESPADCAIDGVPIRGHFDLTIKS